VEYMEDTIEREPHEAFPPVMEGDLLVFKGTGDPVIDAWEAAIASGKTPDLTSPFEESPEVMKWLRGKTPTPIPSEEMPEDFHDDFTKGDLDGSR